MEDDIAPRRFSRKNLSPRIPKVGSNRTWVPRRLLNISLRLLRMLPIVTPSPDWAGVFVAPDRAIAPCRPSYLPLVIPVHAIPRSSARSYVNLVQTIYQSYIPGYNLTPMDGSDDCISIRDEPVDLSISWREETKARVCKPCRRHYEPQHTTPNARFPVTKFFEPEPSAT